jgi:hypothetical protein
MGGVVAIPQQVERSDDETSTFNQIDLALWWSRVFSDTEEIITKPCSGDDAQGEEEAGHANPSDNSYQAAVVNDELVVSENLQREFKGRHPQQYALWGHNMALYAAFISFVFGLATIAWAKGVAQGWDCTVNGHAIDDSLVIDATIKDCIDEANSSTQLNASSSVFDDFDGCCSASYRVGSGPDRCCNPVATAEVYLGGSIWIGIYTIALSFCIGFLENVKLGFGLWQPSDCFFYKSRWSPLAAVYAVVALPLFGAIPSAFAGLCILISASVQQHSFRRGESGDGGRHRLATTARNRSLFNACLKTFKSLSCLCDKLSHPSSFYCSLLQEDKFPAVLCLSVYFAMNAAIFFYSLMLWEGAVLENMTSLLDGNIDLELRANIALVRFGVLSRAGPWAKAAGACLNFNCALVVMPVTKLFNSRALGHSPSCVQRFCGFFFGSLFSPLIPVSKYYSFHKLIGTVIFLFAWLHTVAHLVNYAMASQITLQIFKRWGWKFSAFFTGFSLHLVMFLMNTALSKQVRQAKYEIFIRSHYFFVAFFLLLLLHTPFFWAWALLPLTLFALEKVLQRVRGNRGFVLLRAEWAEPVLHLKFRPLNKAEFDFRDGQYVLLNVPCISHWEWHPFTISSARGDLSVPGSGIVNSSSRVSLRTGEEMYEVPRPSGLNKDETWAKYCPVSMDYKQLFPCELHEKHDTCRCDYVSCHIKVHGLTDTKATTWTRKLKEYVELLCPGQTYPYHFTHRDEYGDVQLGRQFGVDPLQQIMRVDGPHSTPSEHFTNFNTIMLIGEFIGFSVLL